MKKLSILCGALLLMGSSVNAQLIDEKDVTVTMDLQPILQLDMTTSDQLDFVFDDVSDYYAGITRYGATQLRISASVSWDLYAIGRSNAAGIFWDNQVTYSSLGSSSIPLSALEIRQSIANSASGIPDYSAAFLPFANATSVTSNSIYYDAAGTIPVADNRYIAGGPTTAANVSGGSYLTQGAGSTPSNYFYIIDYRILPGLPATFPFARKPDLSLTPIANATDEMSNYATPGVYTMNVQYILLEDQ
jgi:hypothetical protein